MRRGEGDREVQGDQLRVPGRRDALHQRVRRHALQFDVVADQPLPHAVPVDGDGELSEMRDNLFGEHFHVMDLAVEVAAFGAEPKP